MALINDVLYDGALYDTSYYVYFFGKYVVCLLFLKGCEWNDLDVAEAKQEQEQEQEQEEKQSYYEYSAQRAQIARARH